MSFDVGDSVPIAWDVKDATGTLVNASTAVLTVTLPDGTTTLPSVPGPSVAGQYRVTFVPTLEGRHIWRAVMTGPNTAYQDVFEVREALSPALLSLADAKAHLNIPITTSTFDDELREFIESTTVTIEQYVGPIARRTHVRQVCSGGYAIVLPHTQILSITSIVLISDGSSPVTLSDLSINAEAGIISYKNGSSFPVSETTWTYVVGRSYVQPNWSLAAKMILEHNWQSQLGNLPAIQGDDSGVTGNRLVPPRAMLLLTANNSPVGFA